MRRKEVIKMPVKWTRPKKDADSKPKGESKPKAEAPKGGKPKGKKEAK